MAKDTVAKAWTSLTFLENVNYSDPARVPDIVAPTTPGTPSVAASGSTALALSWAASTDASGVAYYIVYRSATSGGTYTQIGTTNELTYLDTGLTASTAYYYKILAVDASANANQSAQSAYGTGTTAAASGGGAWQLAAGHFVSAKMPMVLNHPRPDGETETWERHRKAYYDGINSVQYRIPVEIQGGAAPFYYELLDGPAGMAIGQVYGDAEYGIVTWTPAGNVTNDPVQVKITDQDLNVVIADWTITTSSSTNDFIFVNASTGSNANSGAIGSPLLNTRGWYKDLESDTTFTGRIVYYRTGTHAWYLDPSASLAGNGELTNVNKPMVHLGYPGETVSWDFSSCKVLLGGSARGFFMGGGTIKNSRKIKSRHFFYMNADCHHLNGGGGQRFTFFEVPWRNHQGTVGLRTQDWNSTEGNGIQISWANVSGTNEYYATGPAAAELFDSSWGNTAYPTTVYADYSGTRTALTRVATDIALSVGQYKWFTPSGRLYPTLTVRLSDDTNPNTKGANWLVSTGWNSNVGENAGCFWAFEAGNSGGVSGRRYYLTFSHCTWDYLGDIEETTGRVFDNDGNGPTAFLVGNWQYIVNSNSTYRSCDIGIVVGRGKSATHYITHRFLDWYEVSATTLGTVYLRTGNSYDSTVPNGFMELCWSKVYRGASRTMVQFGLGGYTSDDLWSYRNTLVNAGNQGVYASFSSTIEIDNDLVITNDTDGWYLTVGQTVPANGVADVDFALEFSTELSTHVDASGNVKVASPYYGTHGATVA
jgi:hypothetical protein